MSEQKPDFDSLLTFPCAFVYRCITYAESDILERCVVAIEKAVGKSVNHKEAIASRTKRFLRIHIEIQVDNGNEIHAGYDALREISGIRMVI